MLRKIGPFGLQHQAQFGLNPVLGKAPGQAVRGAKSIAEINLKTK